jgi:hypothetical protein
MTFDRAQPPRRGGVKSSPNHREVNVKTPPEHRDLTANHGKMRLIYGKTLHKSR